MDKHTVKSRKLSRRRFLAMAGVGLAAGALAACAPSAPAPSPARPAEAPKAAAPATTTAPARPTEVAKPAAQAVPAQAPAKPTGRLTIAQGLDPRTLLPLDSTTAQEHNVSGQIVEKLMMYDPSGKIQPWLAAEWKYTNDTTLQIKLRPNVKFTNGEPFDAQAAKFSLELLMKANSYSRYVEDFDRVEIVDPMTVNVVAKRPSAVVLSTIARGSWTVAPRYYAETGQAGFGKKPIGTGPFKYGDWVKDSQIVLEANTDYWGGAPLVERVVFRPIPEPAVRAAALEAGDIDMTIDVSLPDVDRLERNQNLVVQLVEGMRLMGLTLNNIHPGPVQDKRVRQAINYGLDVDTIVKTLFKDRAVRLQGQLASPAYFGYSPSIKAYPYDPEKAKAMLAEAGHPGGFEVEFKYSSGRYAQDKEVGEAIAQQLARVGIRTRQIVLESGEFLTQLNALKLGPMYFGGSLTVPELYFQLSQQLTGATYSYYTNKEYDDLLRQAARTLDDARRLALYEQVSKVAHEDPPYVWMYVPKDAYGINKKVAGFQARSDQWLDLMKVSVR